MKQYLYRRNLIPGPRCLFGAIENNYHLLLECRRFNDICTEMINIVCRFANVTEEILLFDYETLSVETNCEIFKAMHRYSYINKLKRFTPK